MRTRFIGVVLSVLVALVWTANAQEATPEPAVYDQENYTSELVLKRQLVTSIVWASDGRMFWTEKGGVVGTMSPDGVEQEEPVVTVEVETEREQGLQSIALDPNFDTNGYFYIFFTRLAASAGEAPLDFVMRYRFVDGVGTNPTPLLEFPLPKRPDGSYPEIHHGGRLRFGPHDGFLYVSIGDLQAWDTAQDAYTLPGKIHRFAVGDNDLIVAPGNPFVGSSTWAFGFRNTFAFIFDPQTNLIFATENGPACDDEINLVIPARNYGWSGDINCDQPAVARQAGGAKPLVSWTPTIAPTGIMLYNGEWFPDWQGKLFFCSFNLQEMRYFTLNEDHTAFVDSSTIIPLPETQRCMIELAQGPDGYIYYSNVNAIYRLKPLEE